MDVTSTTTAFLFNTTSTGDILKVNGATVYHKRGADNDFIGTGAGAAAIGSGNTAAYEDIGVGTNALGSITNDGDNLAIGNSAMRYYVGSSDGSYCCDIALGANALQSNFAGSVGYNVAVGYNALGSLTYGDYNIAMGGQAASKLGSGSYDIFLGACTGDPCGSTAVNATSSISIGYNVLITASNQLVVGSDSGSNMGSITDAYFGQGVTGTSPTGITFNATGGSGTNNTGANLTIAGGKNTGSNIIGGNIIFDTPDPTSSGSTLQQITEKVRISRAGFLGIGTTSPAAEISASSTATTTLYLDSRGTRKGGCIELLGSNGTAYRMYIAPGDVTGFATSSPNGGHGAIVAVWEPGSCK